MQVEPYEALSRVYDVFMDGDIPYDEWALHIKKILEENGINDGLVCDLGCGSGMMTVKLAGLGYDMTGIDSSPEMLMQARERSEDRDILYLNQDITSFELYGTVRAFVSTGDAMNYIINTEDLCRVFALVKNYLDPGGIFIFDVHTPYYYKEICGSNTFSSVDEEGAYIWENDYDEETGENRYNVTLFIKDYVNLNDLDDQEIYRRYEEEHIEKAYSMVDIKKMAENAGMHILSITDGYTGAPLKADSARALFVVG
ncbi:MAG: class I SAM-dependent methyltransferase [Lachnospiraceae bacterium]|nr:class I SAM-dependent methyltransferase [Lachnospiraceae bacterium]